MALIKISSYDYWWNSGKKPETWFGKQRKTA